MNTQKSSSTTTAYIIIAIVVIVGLVVYFYWNGATIQDSATLEQSNGTDQVVGAEVFRLLGEINSLKIDSTFFNDPIYKTLRDYTVQIPSYSVGRPNPFAPLPGVPLTGTGASANH